MKEGSRYKRARNQILRRLKRKKDGIWELIVNQDVHLSEALAIIRSLLASGDIRLEGTLLSLNTEYPNSLIETRCKECSGHGITLKDFEWVEKRYREMIKGRPLPIKEYDQGYMAPGDVVRRVAFMYERGDVEGTRIMIIGDDDLCSLALASTEMAEKITVLEIDERVVGYINKISQVHGLNVEARIYDVQKDLPEECKKAYDVFVMDPVETIPGITLFLSRGVASLKEEGDSGYFGLSYIEASLKKWRKIEENLLRMNFSITDILRNFAVYPSANLSVESYLVYREIQKILGVKINPDVDFYRSALVRVEAVDEPLPLVRGDALLDREMYVDDEAWATALATKDI